MIYEALNEAVLNIIPADAQTILDIGCGDGTLGRALKSKKHCRVVGITASKEEAAVAAKSLDDVIVEDLNNADTAKYGTYDCIVLSHILEHLVAPESLLHLLRGNLQKNGVLVVALPNPLFYRQRLQFLRGQFRYTDGGIMDRTHLRFYDCQTARELIEQNGYTILESKWDGNLPMPLIRRFLPQSVQQAFTNAALSRYPGLFSAQFVYLCRATSD